MDKVTYTLDSAGMQVNVFATTQPLSNQTVGGLSFPGRFALTLAPSTLILSGTGITDTALDDDQRPHRRQIFRRPAACLPHPATLPATVTVTNTADTRRHGQTAPLVDEVVIRTAS